MHKEKKIVSLRDIIIPKGTVFTRASRKTERMGDDHFSTTVGLSKNTTGDFTYCVDDDFEILDEYFTTLKE